RALRHLLRPPLAHDHLSAIARLHSRAQQGNETLARAGRGLSETKRIEAKWPRGAAKARPAISSFAHQVGEQQLGVHAYHLRALRRGTEVSAQRSFERVAIRHDVIAKARERDVQAQRIDIRAKKP